MAQIHQFSVVDPNAQLADDVVVGPFCVIGPNVKIGAGTVLKSHVNIHGDTTIGERNIIYPNASIGCDPQDKKYAGEPTKLVIGDDNVIREHVTISIGTTQDHGVTTVGNRNLFMANAHVAHDCGRRYDPCQQCGIGRSYGLGQSLHHGRSSRYPPIRPYR